MTIVVFLWLPNMTIVRPRPQAHPGRQAGRQVDPLWYTSAEAYITQPQLLFSFATSAAALIVHRSPRSLRHLGWTDDTTGKTLAGMPDDCVKRYASPPWLTPGTSPGTSLHNVVERQHMGAVVVSVG